MPSELVCGVHGFNVRDGGRRTLEPTLRHFRAAGYPAMRLEYGWVHLARVRLRFPGTVARLQEISPDVVFAHSNGCAIVAEAITQGMRPRAVICYQPAHNKAFVWPDFGGRVLVLYNPRDRAVQAGKWWRRLNPVSWFVRHYWGEAGRVGYSVAGEQVTQWDVSPLSGHSYLSDAANADRIAPRILRWLES